LQRLANAIIPNQNFVKKIVDNQIVRSKDDHKESNVYVN